VRVRLQVTDPKSIIKEREGATDSDREEAETTGRERESAMRLRAKLQAHTASFVRYHTTVLLCGG